MIYELRSPIAVHTRLGDGDALFIIDYGVALNTVWVVRLAGGIIKHFFSEDVRVYANPMDGNGWDVTRFTPEAGQ